MKFRLGDKVKVSAWPTPISGVVVNLIPSVWTFGQTNYLIKFVSRQEEGKIEYVECEDNVLSLDITANMKRGKNV